MGSDGVRREETLGLVRTDARVEPKMEIGGAAGTEVGWGAECRERTLGLGGTGARVEPKRGTEGTIVETGTEPLTGAES
jgi:hypothetical protein